MSGIYLDIVGQGHQSGHDGFEEDIAIGAGQVIAAHTPIEKRITCDHIAVDLIVERKAAGRVTGSSECLERGLAELDQIALMDESLDLRLLARHLYLKYICEAHSRRQHLNLIRMYLQPDMIGLSYERIAGYVVYMAVGVDEAGRLQVQIGDGLYEQRAFGGIAAARIDDDAFLCFIVDYVGILLYRSAGQFNYLAHSFGNLGIIN